MLGDKSGHRAELRDQSRHELGIRTGVITGLWSGALEWVYGQEGILIWTQGLDFNDELLQRHERALSQFRS